MKSITNNLVKNIWKYRKGILVCLAALLLIGSGLGAETGVFSREIQWVYGSENSGNLADKAEQLEDATIPKPNHPETFTNDKLIFIGDSRTQDMMNAVSDNSIWSCKVGAGYDWMTTEGVPNIEGDIENNTAVIFLFGVNDPANIANYINYVNYKANEWDGLGAKTYYVAVGPVTNDPYVTNTQIEAFNESLKVSLAGVVYIDIYTYLMENGYSTVDGTHYPDNVSIAIYNYILSNLEETRSGIWG